jgi:hypothetical protein
MDHKPCHSGFGLTPKTQKIDVVPAQQSPFQFRNYGFLIAENSGENRLPVFQLSNQVLPDFLLYVLTFPTGLFQVAEGLNAVNIQNFDGMKVKIYPLP